MGRILTNCMGDVTDRFELLRFKSPTLAAGCYVYSGRAVPAQRSISRFTGRQNPASADPKLCGSPRQRSRDRPPSTMDTHESHPAQSSVFRALPTFFGSLPVSLKIDSHVLMTSFRSRSVPLVPRLIITPAASRARRPGWRNSWATSSTNRSRSAELSKSFELCTRLLGWFTVRAVVLRHAYPADGYRHRCYLAQAIGRRSVRVSVAAYELISRSAPRRQLNGVSVEYGVVPP